MDKQNSNRTITIKINGNERQILDFPIKENIQNDRVITETVESVEADTLSEVAAGEAVEESFDWILPESSEDEIEEYIIAKQPKGKQKSSLPTLKKQLKKQNIGPVKSIFTSVILAIIIGTSFGFLVLKLVISDAKVEEPVTTITEETTTEKNDPVVTTQLLQLQPIDTFIIQGGVFSSVDSAKIEEQKLKQKGVPTQIIEDNGKAILVLGVADSIENAKAIASNLKASGIEVFAKPYTLPGKELQELTQVEATLLKDASTIYQQLSMLIAGGMVTSAIDENTLAQQKRFLASIDKQEIKSAKIEQLRVDLIGVVTKLEEFKQQQKDPLINDAQQHLLAFIGVYFTL
ncbi:MAG TPA: SPOR domain-containing protein [Pseudoneobacillus sp.]|nr:SPOR domain-containing protein [Pseudoneobacillus sp.]